MFCEKCGTRLTENAKFCDNCGAQTAADQANIQAEKAQNYDAHVDKSISGSVWITVALVIFSAVIVFLFGFEDGEGMVASITAIAFSVFICGVKWFYEIKNQRKWKKEATEKAERGDRHGM